MYALLTAGLSIRIVNLDWVLTSIENIGNQYSFFNLSIDNLVVSFYKVSMALFQRCQCFFNIIYSCTPPQRAL